MTELKYIDKKFYKSVISQFPIYNRDDWELSYKKRKRNNYVYILIKNNLPIYVGCTSLLASRLESHRYTKDFDTFVVVFKSKDRKKALKKESSLIQGLDLYFGGLHNKHGVTKNKIKEIVVMKYKKN